MTDNMHSDTKTFQLPNVYMQWVCLMMHVPYNMHVFTLMNMSTCTTRALVSKVLSEMLNCVHSSFISSKIKTFLSETYFRNFLHAQ